MFSTRVHSDSNLSVFADIEEIPKSITRVFVFAIFQDGIEMHDQRHLRRRWNYIPVHLFLQIGHSEKKSEIFKVSRTRFLRLFRN